MRILLISNWFPPIVSGSSFYASSLALSLKARGHEVIGVTADWGEGYNPEAHLSIPFHRLPIIKIPRLPLFYNLKLMGFMYTPKNFKRLENLVREYQPDLLHLVNHIFDTNLLATKVARSLNVPIIGSITTPIQHQNGLAQKLFTVADRLTVGRFGVQRWDHIVSLDWTVHDYVGRVYGKEAQKKSTVIPLGVRLGTMSQYENANAKRSDRPTILMVGHIHPFRNPVQLVRAMTHVLKEIPQARLVLGGRIEISEPLRVSRELGFKPDQVQFLGETDHHRTLELMKTSHVFATWVTGPYPSLGTAPMEAMLCETPVISDLPENLFGEGKLKNGENILLVNSKDPQAIAGAIIRLLRDETLRQRIGAAGRRTVLEHLGWDRISEQMEELYARILRKKPSNALLS